MNVDPADQLIVALAYETLNRVRSAGTHRDAQDACWEIINWWVLRERAFYDNQEDA